jgi:hypothetical protein
MSMAQWPETMLLAAVTKRLPGPTITSQGGQPPTPKASAATACAPPTQSSASAPASKAAAIVMGSGRGLATQTVATPATRAVTAVMSTLLGSG